MKEVYQNVHGCHCWVMVHEDLYSLLLCVFEIFNKKKNALNPPYPCF